MEPIEEMQEEIEALKIDIDGIKLQLAENHLWFTKAKHAERIKIDQIAKLTSGIAALKKYKKRQASQDRNELIIRKAKEILDPGMFTKIVNEVNNDKRNQSIP